MRGPLAIGAVGCSSDDTVDAVSNIEVSSTMALDAEGGLARLSYKVPNPGEGKEISVRSSVDWLYDFDCSQEGVITFKYASYSDETEDRIGILTLSYPGEQDATVTVTQIRVGGMSFEISIAELGTNHVRANIVPSNNDVYYITMVYSKSAFDSHKEEEIIADDLEYLAEFAQESYNLDIATFLSIYAYTGPTNPEDSRHTFNNLSPETDYYVYCYAISLQSLNPLSSIYKKEFRTESVEQIDCTISVDYQPIGSYDALVTIEPTGPDSEKALYSFTYLNEYAFKSNDYSDELVRNNTLLNFRKSQPEMYRGKLQFRLSELTGSIRVWGGTTYYLYTFGMDEKYNYNTEFVRYEIKTNPIEPTDDCTFELSVSDIRAVDARVDVVPSNPETTYYIGVTPTAAFKYGTLSQIVERTLQRQDGWYDGNNNPADYQTNTWVLRGEQSLDLYRDLGWGLNPEQELTVFVFGFDKTGHRTTAIASKDFKTSAISVPDDFKIEIKDVDNSVLRQISATFVPSDPDVPYYAGMFTKEWFGGYDDWRDFVEDYVHSNGGLPTSAGQWTMSVDCTPSIDYVILAFAYGNGQILSDVVTYEVSAKPWPMSSTAAMAPATWAAYDGTALETLYPTIYKNCSGAVVFVGTLYPNEHCAHYYGLLHQTRRYMDLADGMIYSYFADHNGRNDVVDGSNGNLGFKDVHMFRYLSGRDYCGLFYSCQDETGAWGPMYYEEVDLIECEFSDPMTAPTQFEYKISSVDGGVRPAGATRQLAFSAPLRFSTASFAVAEAERAAYERGPVVCRGEEHAAGENGFDLDAHLTGVIEAQARMNR